MFSSNLFVYPPYVVLEVCGSDINLEKIRSVYGRGKKESATLLDLDAPSYQNKRLASIDFRWKADFEFMEFRDREEFWGPGFIVDLSKVEEVIGRH